MASFADMSAAQTAAIQVWVTEQINSRMELAGREVVGKISEEMARMDMRVEEINLLKLAVEASYAESTTSLQQVSDGVKAFAAKTAGDI